MADEVEAPTGPTRVSSNPFAALPSVSSLLQLARDRGIRLSDDVLTPLFQRVLGTTRDDIASGEMFDRAQIEQRVIAELKLLARVRLTPVLNATGVIIHTNLGRAAVSEETSAAMAAVAAGYVPLEIEPETGRRGGRMSEISSLMRLLTGAEATLVVNNNAAAVLLTLSAVAAGKSVIVSRGEAIEIGGGFRIPDVLRESGAKLVEVGTTNRTYVRDYAAAIDADTAALLKVHPSNFSISGFTAATTVAELAEIARSNGLPVIEDLGSGALVDTRRFGLQREPTIAQSLSAGASIVTASGDKLIGGPQAGIIAGRREWVQRIAAHPLARAVRADKTCLAGLAATLRHYAAGEESSKIPVWRMISATAESVRNRASTMTTELGGAGVDVTVVEVQATVGGGSLPGQLLQSYAVSLSSARIGADDLAKALRLGDPGVYARVAEECVLLDLRTVLPEDDGQLTRAVAAALIKHG